MESYNTASGMSCCNLSLVRLTVLMLRYNTASGMSCCNATRLTPHEASNSKLQYRKRYELLQQLKRYSRNQ